MKKFMSILTVAALLCANVAAMAADKDKGEPDVIVDGSKILFSDQNAKIVDDITLVPARGVFEAMGCKVDWDDETRTVTVTSSTGVRYVTIVIDSDNMKISTYKSLMERTDSDFKLEVPAQIINDRTMIPLRAVSEAFDSEVSWDGEAYAVNIVTSAPILLEGYEPKPEVPDEEKPTISLSTDHEGELKAGDEVTVYVDVKNIPADKSITGIVAVLEYDKNKFECVDEGCGPLDDDGNLFDTMIAGVNGNYDKGAKMLFHSVRESKRTKEGHAYVAVLKSKTGEAGTINLCNDFESVRGYETYIIFNDGNQDQQYDNKEIIVDVSPIIIGE